MFNTPLISILSFVLAAFLGALGQYLYKTAADQSKSGIVGLIANPRMILGMICYVAVMSLLVFAFKKGGSLTVLYPIYATTFIWAAVLANLFFGQPIQPVNIAGMVLLVVGMFLMGL
jgi:multidrug transporter EmrE-like cation transporter